MGDVGFGVGQSEWKVESFGAQAADEGRLFKLLTFQEIWDETAKMRSICRIL